MAASLFRAMMCFLKTRVYLFLSCFPETMYSSLADVRSWKPVMPRSISGLVMQLMRVASVSWGGGFRAVVVVVVVVVVVDCLAFSFLCCFKVFGSARLMTARLNQLRHEPYFSGTHVLDLTTHCTKSHDYW